MAAVTGASRSRVLSWILKRQMACSERVRWQRHAIIADVPTDHTARESKREREREIDRRHHRHLQEKKKKK